MSEPTPKELMRQAMSLGQPARVPVMCQLAIGHTLLQTGIHPVDYFLSSDAYAKGLLQVREIYDFDGILMHKPGRDPKFMELAKSVDRDLETPSIYLKDGARIDCTRNDDPYYRYPDGFERPEVVEIKPDDPFGWAPESFVRWCEHKATAAYRTAEEIPEFWYDCLDRVKAAAGATHSLHGEVRSPFDHLLNIVGMEPGLMALLTDPEHVKALLEVFSEWSVAWAAAQVRRGCDAIKISSPFAGGGFLSPDQYREWILPYEARIAKAVRAEGAFIYTHTCGAIGDRLDLMAESGIHGIETLDPPPLGTVDLAEAKRLLQGRLFIKGNVDPVNAILRKDAAGARAEIEKVYAAGSPGGGYILSTACSVAPPAARENVRQLTECVYAHVRPRVTIPGADFRARAALARAPMRVDPAGGGTDCPPFSVEHGGFLVNFGITRYVHARLEPRAGTREVEIVSHDLGRTIRAAGLEDLRLDGNLDLLKAVCKRLAPPWGFALRVESDVPPGSGLGSSGAVGVACVGAFDEALGVRRSQEETAELANAIERNDMGNAGGNQDSYGAALGGLNLLTYRKGGGTSIRRLEVPEGARLELERRCVLVYTGEVHLSGTIHKDIRQSYALPNSPTVEAMKNLARVARECAAALEAGDVDRFGRLLSENWVHHKRLHESCDSPTLRKYYAAAEGHVAGGKTCGAGGGGCVLFLARDGQRRDLERACEALGGRLIPFGIDRTGLLRWTA